MTLPPTRKAQMMTRTLFSSNDLQVSAQALSSPAGVSTDTVNFIAGHQQA